MHSFNSSGAFAVTSLYWLLGSFCYQLIAVLLFGIGPWSSPQGSSNPFGSVLEVELFSILTLLIHGIWGFIAVFSFLSWFHGAYACLRSVTGEEPGRQRSWGFLAFILPGFNLFMPYLMAREIFRRLNDEWARRFDAETIPRSGGLITAWWSCYVLYGLFLVGLVIIDPEVTEGSDVQMRISMAIVCAFGLISTVLTIRVVRAISGIYLTLLHDSIYNSYATDVLAPPPPKAVQ